MTTVGLDDALARDLDRFRIHQVADVSALVRNLRADLEDRRDALNSYGVGGVLEARSRATDMESWAPHIVILAETPIGSLRDDLAELVARMPRLGIATIAQGDALVAGATVVVTSKEEAEYRSGGALLPLPFRPQILGGDELELVRSLFSTTTLDAQPVDLEEEHPHTEAAPVVDEVSDDDMTSADSPAAVDVAPAEDEEIAETVAVADVEETGEHLVEEAAAAKVPDWPAPYIRILGPVDALNVADQDALPGRGIEFLAFLLLQNTASVPGALVQKKLWPDTFSSDNNNARQLAKQIRLVLGHDPDGKPLPPERSSVGFSMYPHVRTDWHDFCDLIGPDLSTTLSENLIQAIRLVRGQPFDGVSRRRGWWAWRGPIEETMRAAILDAADELTHRALRTGRLDDARFAARIAQSADPLNEAGWRLEIETAMSNGDVDAFNKIIDAMYEVIGTDVDIDDATQQLIDDAHAKLPGWQHDDLSVHDTSGARNYPPAALQRGVDARTCRSDPRRAGRRPGAQNQLAGVRLGALRDWGTHRAPPRCRR
ncbi:AfsR/SARP family transcriptional regulator [Microbacterium sp. CH12i]|uniref:AfsR/SARP family transcriptional regulator n=1 Tax=Microbacterium sp. CH12i TaxID=1479651 RepID=UPI000AA64D67|nr:bacterial transcriptional activator domain-containing protein [Microbacterium sp. CH12i]